MERNIENAVYVEQRRIGVEDLRSLCIMHGWYTRGTSREYDKLFQLACTKDNLKTEDIVEIAADIIAHSMPESYDGYEFEDVMFAVIDKTYTTVIKIFA